MSATKRVGRRARRATERAVTCIPYSCTTYNIIIQSTVQLYGRGRQPRARIWEVAWHAYAWGLLYLYSW